MRGQWARVVLVIGVGALVAGLVFLYLWQGSVLTLLRAERARALLALEELGKQRDWLQVQVSQAYSPEAVAKRARSIGMGPFDPSRTRYLVLEDGQGAGD
jgi:hypothetical protein